MIHVYIFFLILNTVNSEDKIYLQEKLKHLPIVKYSNLISFSSSCSSFFIVDLTFSIPSCVKAVFYFSLLYLHHYNWNVFGLFRAKSFIKRSFNTLVNKGNKSTGSQNESFSKLFVIYFRILFFECQIDFVKNSPLWILHFTRHMQ